MFVIPPLSGFPHSGLPLHHSMTAKVRVEVVGRLLSSLSSSRLLSSSSSCRRLASSRRRLRRRRRRRRGGVSVAGDPAGRPTRGSLEAGISLCTACGPARARAGPLARGPSAAQGVHKVIFCFPALGSVARRAPLMRWLCPVAAGLRQGDCHLVWGARPVRVAAGPLCRESCAPTFSLPARRMSL